MKVSERKFGFPHGIKIRGRTHERCIYKVRDKDFKLDGWDEWNYPIFKATTKYGNEDVYLVHDNGLFRCITSSSFSYRFILNDSRNYLAYQ